MKNIIKKLLIIITVFFLLCSCTVKNDSNINISKDGRLAYRVLIAFDKDIISGLSLLNNNDKTISVEEYVSENIKDSYLRGFEKEKYSDKDFVGNTYTYEIDDINKITSSSDNVINIDGKDRIVDNIIFSKTNDIYTANIKYNLEDKNITDDVDFINTFTVNLPARNIKNNADESKNFGKTLIWHIKNGEEKNINFSFKLNKDNHLYISIISIVLDIIMIVVFFIIKNKKVM